MSPERARAWALPVFAAVLAIVVWAVPFQAFGVWTDTVITDIPVYQAVSDAISRGDLPYRDVPLEYPPGAAVLFWVAGILPGDYETGFTLLMLGMWALACAGAVVAARALGMGRARQYGVAVAMAAVPLLLGNVIETRFDAAVSALLAWMVAAAAAERWRWVWGLLAVAVLVKLAPVALIPVLAVWHAHRVDWRSALRGIGGAAVAIAAVIIPIAVIAPSGLWDMVRYHLDRPPQLESLTSSYMMLLHVLADVPVTVEYSFGSQGLSGSGPGIVGSLTTMVVVTLLAAVAVVLAGGLRRARPGADARLMASAAACSMAIVLAGGKVLSPQFMLWLVPVGLLVSGPYGRAAFGTTLAALLVTQLWFPTNYWDLVALHDREIWLLVVRNGLLLCLVAMCWPRPSWATRPPTPPLMGRDPDTAGTGPDHAVSARFLTD